MRLLREAGYEVRDHKQVNTGEVLSIEIGFKTKPEIALAQIRWTCEAGPPRGAVLMDAGYGVDTDLRTSITGLGSSYVAGTKSHTTVWAPGIGPRPAKK